jgi:hypothetical protein
LHKMCTLLVLHVNHCRPARTLDGRQAHNYVCHHLNISVLCIALHLIFVCGWTFCTLFFLLANISERGVLCARYPHKYGQIYMVSQGLAGQIVCERAYACITCGRKGIQFVHVYDVLHLHRRIQSLLLSFY